MNRSLETPVVIASEETVTKKPILRIRPHRNQIPESIINSVLLQQAIKVLPGNYNFEIYKTIWRILNMNAKVIALQFPEGLLLYACIISDIFVKFCNVETIILGDVTYGACCIDDFTASKLGAELLVHYGHSCLVPISTTVIPTMYVFVEISFDHAHLVDSIVQNFSPNSEISLMGTIQFVNILHLCKKVLSESPYNFSSISIPQSHPLSMGETLGCTSPRVNSSIIVFVADGRFHLESAMIMNPSSMAYRYDPYSKILSQESYDHQKMKMERYSEIMKARSGAVYGVILGTLGRQGNRALYDRMVEMLRSSGKVVIPFLMSEISPVKLSQLQVVDVWVQVACPRLSIDWGLEYGKPLLTTYELEVALGKVDWKDVYPMDYYSASGGDWTNLRS